MTFVFWALGLLAVIAFAIFLMTEEARQDRLEADAWNSTRPKQDFR
jgi:hypothetical protein